jgi:phage terminase large subunit GpA-like protein
VGFHLNSIYPKWDSCNFGAVARQYLIAKNTQDPTEMQAFVNNYLALPYSLEQAGIELVSDGAIDNAQGTYQRNQIPPGVRALVMGGDVGLDQTHYIVVGLGDNSEAWIISWGTVANQAMLSDIAAQLYSHPAGVQIRIFRGGVDARYQGQSVFDLCRRQRILQPVQGIDTIREPGKTTPIPFKTWTPDKDVKGRTPVNALKGLSVNTYYFKQIIYSRLNPQEGQPRILHLPVDADDMLRRHLQSEHEITERRRGSAELKKRWVKRKGFDANHLLDCLVYALATAYACKLFRLPAGDKIYGAIKSVNKDGANIHGDPGGAGEATETETQSETNPEKPVEKKKTRRPNKQYIPLSRGFLSRR